MMAANNDMYNFNEPTDSSKDPQNQNTHQEVSQQWDQSLSSPEPSAHPLDWIASYSYPQEYSPYYPQGYANFYPYPEWTLTTPVHYPVPTMTAISGFSANTSTGMATMTPASTPTPRPSIASMLSPINITSYHAPRRISKMEKQVLKGYIHPVDFHKKIPEAIRDVKERLKNSGKCFADNQIKNLFVSMRNEAAKKKDLLNPK